MKQRDLLIHPLASAMITVLAVAAAFAAWTAIHVDLRPAGGSGWNRILNPDVFGMLFLFSGGAVAYLFQMAIRHLRVEDEYKKQLVHSENRARGASRVKTAFLANMSHEIRTPLGALLGYAEILANETSPPTRRKEIIDRMRCNVERITELIDDILDIAKIEANEMRILPQWIDLPELLRDLERTLKQKSASKPVTTVVKSELPLPQKIFSDELRLRQVLFSLINNAVKFTEHGRIDVAVFYDPDENILDVTVTDSGCGVPEDAQNALFEPFSQADASCTRKFGGTGIGLALSRRLANLLGGRVSLAWSEAGRGSSFKARIKAPYDKSYGWSTTTLTTGTEKKLLEGKKPLDGHSILLVEDSPDNQDIFRYFLKDAGGQVDSCITGLEALKMTEKNNYDLILMDIQMPELDGKQTTTLLRKKGWKGPIVALTAHGSAEERKSVLAAGCDAQITKPVTKERLIFEVREMILKRKTGSGEKHGNTVSRTNQIPQSPA